MTVSWLAKRFRLRDSSYDFSSDSRSENVRSHRADKGSRDGCLEGPGSEMGARKSQHLEGPCPGKPLEGAEWLADFPLPSGDLSVHKKRLGESMLFQLLWQTRHDLFNSPAKSTRWRDSTFVLVLTIILSLLVLKMFDYYDAPVASPHGRAVVAGVCFVIAGSGVWLWKRFRG
jgi:hypothetical protein